MENRKINLPIEDVIDDALKITMFVALTTNQKEKEKGLPTTNFVEMTDTITSFDRRIKKTIEFNKVMKAVNVLDNGQNECYWGGVSTFLENAYNFITAYKNNDKKGASILFDLLKRSTSTTTAKILIETNYFEIEDYQKEHWDSLYL